MSVSKTRLMEVIMKRFAFLLCVVVLVLCTFVACDECEEAQSFWGIVGIVGEHPAHHYGNEDAAVELIAPGWSEGGTSKCSALQKAEEIKVDGTWFSYANYARINKGCDRSDDELWEEFQTFWKKDRLEGKYPPCTCVVWVFASPDDVLQNFSSGEEASITSYTGDWCEEGSSGWF